MPAGRTKDTKADLESLIPGHEYKFRVMAVNSEGESIPLETTDSIIAKNPYGESSNLLKICGDSGVPLCTSLINQNI